jgi:CHAT domain-containing protein
MRPTFLSWPAFVAAVWLIAPTSALAFGETCADDEPGFANFEFARHRTAFAGAEHKARALTKTDDDGAIKRKIVALKKSLGPRIFKTGSEEHAVLQTELLLLGGDLSEADQGRLADLLRKEFDRGVTTQAGAEAFAAFALLDSSGDAADKVADEQRAERVAAALAAHRRLFGDQERQLPLWSRLIDLRRPEERLDLAKSFHAAATNMGSEVAVFESGLLLLAGLPETDPLYRPTAERVALLARELVERPATKTEFDYLHCLGQFSGLSVMVDAVGLVGTPNDKLDFIRRASRIMAQTITLETHGSFVFEDSGIVIASRLADREAYEDAMQVLGERRSELERYMHESSKEDPGGGGLHIVPLACRDPSTAKICGLLLAAQLLTYSGARGPVAIALLQDANALAAADNVDPKLANNLRITLAETEWRHGQRSLAAAFVTGTDPAELKASALPSDYVTYQRLRAEIANAALEPTVANESFAEVVAVAIATEMSKDASVDAGAITETANTLVRRYGFQSFCEGCGAQAVETAKRWLLRSDGQTNPGAAATNYLLYRLLPEIDRKPAEVKTLEGRLRKALGSAWAREFEAARSQMSKATDDDVVRAVALKMLLLHSVNWVVNDVEDFQDNVGLQRDAVVRFLVEENLDKKRAAWSDITEALFSEDSLEEMLDRVDDFARYLFASGYSLAARTVLETLADQLALAPSANAATDARQDADALRVAKGRPPTWASIYARLAARAATAGDFAEANARLDTASRIVKSSLADEWTKGPDHVAPLLRELKPTLRLIAQIRIVTAIAGEGEEASDARNRAFEELQYAMLGDTALGLQAALRRRLLADPTLAAAVSARDSALLTLTQLEDFDAAVGTLDHARFEEERDNARAKIEEASKVAEALLPVSESVGSLAPMSLAEAQGLLASDEGVLLLHAGSDAVYGGFVANSGEPTFWRVEVPRAKLEAQVTTLRKGVDLGPGSYPNFPVAEAHEFFRQYLGPIEEQLSSKKRLLVSADGPFNSLPLAILAREAPLKLPKTPSEMRDLRIKWLGLSHAIAYVPTIRALESRKADKLGSRAAHTFAGIGNPVFAGNAAEVRRIDFSGLFGERGLADVELLRHAQPLPETETEVRSFSKLLEGREEDLFLRSNASEAAVRANGLGDYRVIVFATHGLMGGELASGSEPGLVLTPPSSASIEDDGLLTASEIMNLRLDADLVVLSACNTAASDGRPQAEGFSGLTRAFLDAGARSVIVTHWAIPSEPAVEVTARMIAARKGDPKLSWSEALRRSFEQVVNEVGGPLFAHPASWGAFTVVGAESTPEP